MIRMINTRKMRRTGYVTLRERSGMHTGIILVGKPEGKRPLGRPKRRREDNIRMDFREIEWNGMKWIYLARGSGKWWAPVTMVMNFQVP
jgi:hypothetical protein